jgi:hypothetical protein
MKTNYNDGGRSKYFKGEGGDCVARSIAIASELDYMEVYNALADGNKNQRRSKYDKVAKTGKKTALHGINTRRKWFKDYMVSLGFDWTATMMVGQGCKTHLKAEELPKGRIVCAVSKHYVAVINGVINDTHDPSRDGTRCVYGYWKKKEGSSFGNSNSQNQNPPTK